MKRIKILACTALSVLPLGMLAQKVELWSDVPVLLNSLGHKISPDGSFSTGEAIDAGSAWGRDNVTGEVYYYDQSSCGDGNSVSKDHIVVGTDKVYMKAAFLMPKANMDPVLIPSLEKYSESYAHGITWDGTRMVGIVKNPNSSGIDEVDPDKQRLSYLPFYCDIDPDTQTVSDPVYLPTPPQDFFGLPPSYCTAYYISDDGSTILGQVIDNSGNYIYPIVYKENANGEWAYSLPSKDLFNPNGLEVPHYPVPEVKQPDPINYIGDPGLKALFETYLQEMLNGGDVNPYDMLDPAVAGDAALMTKEEWQQYQFAVNEYTVYYNSVYSKLLDQYYEDYSKFLAQSYNFLQSTMAMNRAGTMIGQTRTSTRFSGNTPVKFENPVVFNLEDNTYYEYGNSFYEMQVTQILPDGTLIGVTPLPGPNSPDLTPQHSYVCAPGTTEFVPIEEYIKADNPEYYEWLQKYLFHEVAIGYNEFQEIVYKEMFVTGMVAVSDDFSALSGGVDAWSWDFDNGDYYTYIFSNVKAPEAGIEDINIDPNNNGYKVFNLQGVKVLETKNQEQLQNLPKGIYIINGKKILVK